MPMAASSPPMWRSSNGAIADRGTGRDEPLTAGSGRPGVDLDVLIANLRQRGSIRLFATTLRGELGVTAEVEVSAAAVMNGGQPVRLRHPRRRPPASGSRTGAGLPRSLRDLPN